MDFFYLIGLHQVETEMKRQFEYAEKPQPERPETRRRVRPAATQQVRLAIGAALYRLATAIDPAAPTPSRQPCAGAAARDGRHRAGTTGGLRESSPGF